MTTASMSDRAFELPPGCDASATWMFDPMHFPRPLPPLSGEILTTVINRAFGLEATIVNGYSYTRDFAPPPPTPEVLEKGVVRIWEDEFVPSIAAFCERIRREDYSALSAAELAGRLPAIIADAGDQFRYTMIVVFPFMGPTLAAVEFADHVLGADGPLLVGSLLQGYENETSAAGSGLGELRALAAGSPEVAAAIREGRPAGELDTVPGGRQFMDGLQRYLAEYGWRVDDWAQMHVPTWAENPDAPLRMIRAFLSDGGSSPTASIQRATDQRAAAEAELRQRLAGAELAQLQEMLAVARPHVAISEGRARWQLTIAGSLRVPILALGEKLRALGALEDANDAFFLSAAELRSAADSPAGVTALVERRKSELAEQQRLAPPPFLGAPPVTEGLPPEVESVFRRFFGLREPSAEGGRVMGHAASKGVARGRARVIRSLDESDRLEPGDVLVCGMTAPPWTPLFAIAAAVVTDTGGVMSHSAICAREFAIPCVTGTQLGTMVIPDGAMITVDGDNGVVTIE